MNKKYPRLKKPVFIVGCTNSGTKCLFNSLLQHEELGGLKNELHHFGIQPNIEGRLNRLFALYPCFNTNYANDIKEVAQESGPTDPELIKTYLLDLMEILPEKLKVPGKRFLIKDPKLSLRINWISQVFPDAKIIAIIRNPWSVAEGIKRKLPVHGDIPMKLDIPTATAQWINTNTIITMNINTNKNLICIRYEDLIKSNKYPINKITSKLWNKIFTHIELNPGNFTIPNSSKYSLFDNTKDKFSIGNLSNWEIDFIDIACKHLNQIFHYNKPERK